MKNDIRILISLLKEPIDQKANALMGLCDSLEKEVKQSQEESK